MEGKKLTPFDFMSQADFEKNTSLSQDFDAIISAE